MTEEMSPLALLDATTTRYRETEQAHEHARQEVVAAALAALRAGERPTDVAEHSPFTDSYIRRVARENGIEPAPRGKRPKSRVE
ncbi:hypothetical protein [Streptosporangium sp. NPDC002524]|uniref:hypothetical protein n=1 Tax=Streptosporangium sp. NPDC002524 TaxID=3154537 RepID=UPI00332D8CC7